MALTFRRGRTTAVQLMAGAALAALIAGGAAPAFAQSAGAAPVAAKADESAPQEIIVTGTLVRGLKAPTGSQLLTVNKEQIQATGSTDAVDLLNQTVPQLPTFNTVATGGAGYGLPVTRLGLRGFGNGTGSAAGATGTLILFNGHRVVPVGILTTDPDPQLLPADVLDSVQIMPDGGSATYGSDAVGGVINFVTRKRVDGTVVHAQQSVADNYNETNLSVVTGTSWDGGSLVISAVHDEHNALFGKDRSYITQNFTSHGGADYRSTSCPYGSFTTGGKTYVGPNFAQVASAPLCQQADYSSLVPSEQRSSVFAYVEQRLSDSVKFSMDGLISMRTDHVYVDTASIPASLTITPSNPYFHSVAGETSQTVSYNYSRALGPSLVTPQTFKEFQVDPSISWRINSDWDAKFDLLYGKSWAILHDHEGLNSAAINANNIDPYDTSLMSSSVKSSLADYQTYTKGVNTLSSAQFVLNGRLMTLPGGDLRIAAGAEYRKSELSNLTYTGPQSAAATEMTYPAHRTITAEFAELYVPIIGKGNQLPLVKQLSLDFAVRYDDYSDFGGTTNPRFGIDYRPFDDLLIRANYQTTFDAPSLADSGNQIDTRFIAIPIVPHYYLAVIAGAGQNVQPEKGKTFSIGADWTPHMLPGLRLNATYWHTQLDHLIGLSLGQYGLVGTFSTPYNLCGAGIFFPASANGPCTAAYINSIQSKWVRTDFGSAPGITSVADLFTGGNTVIGFLDARRGNFGTEKMDGIDFSAQYNWNLSFGHAFADLAGTYVLNKDISSYEGGPYVDYLSGGSVVGATPRYNLVASLGLSHGPFIGRVQVTHNAGYNIPTGTAVGQSKVDSFTLVGLFFSADLGHFSITKRNTFEVSVDNLFDQDPPYYGAQVTNGTLGGFANGGTLGRTLRVGLRSSF